LDPDAKKAHGKAMRNQNKSTAGLREIPIVVGERMANLTPPKMAELIEKNWHALGGDADIYLKYSPYEIRYDPKHETTTDLNRLDRVRIQRQPLIYALKNIMKDLAAGASLRNRIISMVTS
jgi:hypothetical protein